MSGWTKCQPLLIALGVKRRTSTALLEMEESKGATGVASWRKKGCAGRSRLGREDGKDKKNSSRDWRDEWWRHSGGSHTFPLIRAARQAEGSHFQGMLGHCLGGLESNIWVLVLALILQLPRATGCPRLQPILIFRTSSQSLFLHGEKWQC